MPEWIMSETIAIIFAAACVAIILAHCGIYIWIRKLEGR
jgi:hypothetical protein